MFQKTAPSLPRGRPGADLRSEVLHHQKSREIPIHEVVPMVVASAVSSAMTASISVFHASLLITINYQLSTINCYVLSFFYNEFHELLEGHADWESQYEFYPLTDEFHELTAQAIFVQFEMTVIHS